LKYVTTHSGQKHHRQTTDSLKFYVKWHGGTEQWVPLRMLKESFPVDVAEQYAFSKGIQEEAAFAWWVPYTLRKCDVMISAVNARVTKVTHKYGIEVPNSLDNAREIDAANGNSFWHDAINKEMANVKVAFEILEPGKPIPVGWKKASGHLEFDVKMDFTRKAQLV